jgi:hypothetical protein
MRGDRKSISQTYMPSARMTAIEGITPAKIAYRLPPRSRKGLAVNESWMPGLNLSGSKSHICRFHSYFILTTKTDTATPVTRTCSPISTHRWTTIGFLTKATRLKISSRPKLELVFSLVVALSLIIAVARMWKVRITMIKVDPRVSGSMYIAGGGPYCPGSVQTS